jgi:sortase A
MINQGLRILEGIVLVAFLVLVGFGGIALSNLNKVSKSAWGLPTLTPTPLIRALILPGGNSASVPIKTPQFTGYDFPLHIQSIMRTNTNIPIPTPAAQQGIRIQIDALDIDAPIVQGDEDEQLKKGVGQHPGTANPGEIGNMVLSGHNDTYGEVFRYLDQLKAGDEIIIYTSTRSYTYVIEGWTLVEPDHVEVMDPTPYESVTLISCYPYLVDNLRIIVKARIQKD